MNLQTLGLEFFKFICCTKCKNPVTAPVRCCLRGHTVCFYCEYVAKACPTCPENQQLQEIPQLTNLLNTSNFTIECRYKNEGCEYLDKISALPMHLFQCQFRDFRCKIDDACQNKLIKCSLLKEHWRTDHGYDVDKEEGVFSEGDLIHFRWNASSNETKNVKIGNRRFCICCAKHNGALFIWLFNAEIFDGYHHMKCTISCQISGDDSKVYFEDMPIHSLRMHTASLVKTDIGFAYILSDCISSGQRDEEILNVTVKIY